MTSDKFHDLFGGKPRSPEEPLTQKEMDLAASIQVVLEDVLLSLCKSIASSTGQKNLCLAGGVALNCVANGKLLRANLFQKIWIQPAAGDAGGAVGAALAAYHMVLGQDRVRLPNDQDGMNGTYLGPEFSNQDIEHELIKSGAVYEILDEANLIEVAADALANGLAIGWHQGRMEFGPRSLGARSILCDPRSPLVQKQLNLKIKYRESFRPFAPAVLRADVSEWFEFDIDSPYMLFVANVQERHKRALNEEEQKLFGIEKLNIPKSIIPAVTHVDYSARIQTVDERTNTLFYKLIKRFKEITKCPMLVNTSFNVRGEPIVMSPTDAFRCFMGTELDMLVIGNFVLKKINQNPNLKINYEGVYELD